MTHPAAPAILLMNRTMGRLRDGDLLATRCAMPDLKLRWARNRFTTRIERPCLAIAFVSDEPADDGQFAVSTDEMPMILAMDLVIDMAVESETSAEENQSDGLSFLDYDPTGLGDCMFVLKQALRALRECCMDPLRDSTELGRSVDWIQQVSIDDDDELPNDDGRLVARINVIYRTSSWDPMELLEREAP